MTSDPKGQKSSIYGPSTPQIRRFLMHLASLGAGARSDIADRYRVIRDSQAFVTAELAIGLAIEQGGRVDARDAVAGPLLQLVRKVEEPVPTDEPLALLDPVAEPALAAVLALLVADLVSADHSQTLYAPFEPFLPRDELDVES
jgi:hypothetical protein